MNDGVNEVEDSVFQVEILFTSMGEGMGLFNMVGNGVLWTLQHGMAFVTTTNDGDTPGNQRGVTTVKDSAFPLDPAIESTLE